jgi:hypothetical protein
MKIKLLTIIYIMSQDDTLNFEDALNEYFKLKDKFENDIKTNKKQIINNSTLSKREKRAEYLKLMPKCVNCKRPSKKGTIFSTTYHLDDDKTDSYRTLKATCGDLADPCNLNIEIMLGKTESIEDTIKTIRNEIKDIKNDIIDNKNKLLFGLITTESAVEKFDAIKTYLSDLTSLYEMALDKFNNITDNIDKKNELDEALVQSFINIDEIKKCIKKMKENDDTQYAIDAVEIYTNLLSPLLNKIRHLKYAQNMVYNDEYTNTCRLIQNKVSLIDLNLTNNNKVINFDVGLKVQKDKKDKKRAAFIIESDEDEDEEKGKFSIKIKEPEEKKIYQPYESKKITEIPPDEPIIGKGDDGIDWHLPEYKNLWSKLPPKLKTEFKLNIEWMKDFMYKCLNARFREGLQFKGCRLPTPPNLILPPREMSNGQVDFGVSIYNIAFNKMPLSLQKTYLTFYKEDSTTKEKNYSMLEDAMNSLVEKEVDFGRGIF